MPLLVIDTPSQALLDEIEDKIRQFNLQNWELHNRRPLAVVLNDEHGKLQAGASARTFGNWLLIDYLWVEDCLRGQNIGSQLLQELEAKAVERGCRYALLDTLKFQARPFYEKHGYTVQWEQQHYPLDGSKFFMTKSLTRGDTR
jgi:GNAT superfamily N-acetyltransferase